jgi:hypothetical protein
VGSPLCRKGSGALVEEAPSAYVGAAEEGEAEAAMPRG